MRLFFVLFSVLVIFGCKKEQATKEVISDSKTPLLEKYRPSYHFTPQKGWMNDPNGMIYYAGEYHLYYQHNPDSNVWGPMHWGHAVSKDLVQWEHLPIAIFPDSLGTIFSGSMVLDSNNTAGFGKNAFVAIFTQHNMDGEKAGRIDFQTQSIAYSLDKGRTFKMWEGNPVVKNPGIKDFRDPKVIWHQESKSWVMVLAAYDKVLFYNSPDLKQWKKTGEFGIKGDDRLWECPDLVRMTEPTEKVEKWALIVSIQKKAPHGGTGVSYFIGDFDGQTFKSDKQPQQWLDYGKDHYAFVTFHNSPYDFPVGIGWMSNWQYAQNVPTTVWRSAMTTPRRLELKKDFDKFILKHSPVDSTSNYIAFDEKWRVPEIGPSMPFASNCEGKGYRLKFGYKKPQNGTAWVSIRNKKNEEIKIGYDADKARYFVDRKNAGISSFSPDFANQVQYAPVAIEADRIDFDILIDHNSVEVFANDYFVAFTNLVFPTDPYSSITLIDPTRTVKFMKGWLLEFDEKKLITKTKSISSAK
jgi:fructan beta-fructosidase